MVKSGLKRWGGALALLGYCFQFFISVGHLHADEIYGKLGHAVEIGSGVAVVAASPSDTSDHAGSQNHTDASDTCEICAVVHLAASGVLPGMVGLPIPAVSDIAVARISAPLLLTSPPYFLSRTRAPPASVT